MTQRQNQHYVLLCLETVQRDKARFSLRNDELAQFVFGWTADERMAGEDGYGFVDQVERFELDIDSFGGKEIAEAFEVGKCATRIAYSCHGFLPGLAVASPCRRRRR